MPYNDKRVQSVKFFYNGVKVNGGNLQKYHGSVENPGTQNEYVRVFGKDYKELPSEVFDVKNDSDSMTDYFVNDTAVVYPDNPFYPYIRSAVAKRQIKELSAYIEWNLAHGYSPEDVGIKSRKDQLDLLKQIPAVKHHPTAEDIARFNEWKKEKFHQAEVRAQVEEDAKQAELESMHRMEVSETTQLLDNAIEEFPLVSSEPYVIINWSECPAFNRWEDNELSLSLCGAEAAFTILDFYYANRKDVGYRKTKFTVHFPCNGEDHTYTGRYDLGDNDGGLIKHIQSFAEYSKSDDIINFANKLKEYIY